MSFPRCSMLIVLPVFLSGCALGPAPGEPMVGPDGQLAPMQGVVQNPAPVGAIDRDFLWEQIVDVVDDYFSIAREQRVRMVDNVLIEGRIETLPQDGSTLLEPHRHDSIGYFNRLESTLQTIRRRGQIRVIPTQDGYLVDVEILKELEDLPQPEFSVSDNISFRTDPRGHLEEAVEDDPAGSWIPLGRDVALEQAILGQVYARISAAGQLAPPPTDPYYDATSTPGF